LAERYTEIIKLLFISVFYVLTIPAAMFIAAVSFLAYFLIDRFLLFRRWRETPLMGAAVARR
jgi:hypothetical protein